MPVFRLALIVLLPPAFCAALNLIYYILNNWVALSGMRPGPGDTMTAIALFSLLFIPAGLGFVICLKRC